ncbi:MULTISPECIES: hypothetical protein [Hyphomicrobiales]|uniref:Uncharacterized protein n=2 Tax=Prosthecodimorpha TaxID=2981530 RepID=A0A0P6VLM5_9HYPH|nr:MULTISPECIES: hypothetical protein [Hyphomicrobiales]KPL52107.1 hypothetical protein ABB55_07610 [Prosthecomicrobium hirschii]MBT9288718.1 hypothetical protein [Prosthecodimorpha staleyi]MCW1843510.1 hypothetical protein [Prosthecomicrobium hirschii]TPQ49014.1 hypothetical protein C2U72_20730 [Prosthecomicrobium hirschii]
MRIRYLDRGVESISVWQEQDEVHLPKEGGLAPAFLPQYRALDEITRRPSLDERLPRLLQPDFLDPDLLDPATLTDTRIAVRDQFIAEAARSSGRRKAVLELAASHLEDSVAMDEEVRRSLAVLLRG